MNEDLIEWLNDLASDMSGSVTSEALSKAATELTTLLHDQVAYKSTIDHLVQRCEKAEARVTDLERKLSFRNQCWQEEMLRAAKAEEALKPFAAQADRYDPLEGDDDHPLWGAHQLTIGDCRRARATLDRIGK